MVWPPKANLSQNRLFALKYAMSKNPGHSCQAIRAFEQGSEKLPVCHHLKFHIANVSPKLEYVSSILNSFQRVCLSENLKFMQVYRYMNKLKPNLTFCNVPQHCYTLSLTFYTLTLHPESYPYFLHLYPDSYTLPILPSPCPKRLGTPYTILLHLNICTYQKCV